MSGGSRGGGPPRWVRWVLRLLLPEEEREYYLGDLHESGRRTWLREILGAAALRLPRARAGRRAGGGELLVSLLSDVRFGIRRLVRAPTTTVPALAALSIGIGLPALMFALVNGALLTELSVDPGERVARVVRAGWAPIGVEEVRDWSARQRSFEGLGVAVGSTVALSIEGEGSEPVSSAALDATVLELLSVEPVLGRAFSEADAAVGPAVALVGYDLWRDRLHGDPAALGTVVRVDGVPATVVGVLPEGFGFPWDQELWTPLDLDRADGELAGEASVVFGVLREGVPLEAAAAELDAIDAERPRLAGEAVRARVRVAPFTDMFAARGQSLAMAGLLMAVALLVLLVACANVANVLLARATARGRELAIRTAMGASRARVALQSAVEVAVLAATGALGGVLVAALGVRLVRDAMPRAGMPFWVDIRLDAPVLVFVSAVAALAAALAGVIPALRASRADAHDRLRDGGRGGSSRHTGRLMGRLIGVELAVSFTLLVAAGLFVRSAMNYRTFDFGFAPEEVHTSRVRLPAATYREPPTRTELVQRLTASLAAVPGAHTVTVATALPGVGGAPAERFAVEGVHGVAAADLPRARTIVVGPDFFETFRAPLAAGRGFESTDGPGTLPVAIVNQSFARRYLPGSAVGRRIAFPTTEGAPEWITVIGVTPDLLAGGLDRELEEAVYRPVTQSPPSSFYLAVRSVVPPAALAQPIREAVARLDRDVALFDPRPLDEVVDLANAQYAWLSALFLVAGGLALFLAAVGLYGVMAFWVAQRTRELGVRMALGGERRTVVGLVLRQAGAQMAIGLSIGMAFAALSAWALRGVLFDVRPLDPVVFGSVLGVLSVAGCLGCWIPALRATRVDPRIALTAE